MQTILIVDDVADNIKLLKGILSAQGYNIKVANNGQRALDIVAKEPIADLVLLDVMMPGMNGYDVCKELKKDSKTKNIPVIFVTAKSELEDEEIGFEVGAVDYVAKPICRTTVVARVKTHLQLKEFQDSLSKKVQEETDLRLHQEKILMQQSKQAAMGEMIDAIAHQWMQPLTIVAMYVETLQLAFIDGTLTETYFNRFYKDFRTQIVHLTDTMNEFRGFLRPVNDDESFIIDEAIKSTLTLLKDQLIKHTISVETFLEKGIVLDGSATEFKHILINLINNAKDAFVENDTKNRTITISLKKENIISMEVSDNAGGIPEAIIGEIFKPHITTKAEDKGTGIGLYMSQQIAQKLGATLEVENIENGVKFVFVKTL